MNPRRKLLAGAVACAALFSGVAAAADAYPTRPITIVVGFPPGGATDIVARVLGKYMGDRLGQSVVVENKPGATGSIASVSVATAPPDGYRILLTAAGPHGVMPAIAAHLPYDAMADFTPIGAICGGPNVLVVNNSLPVKNVQELLAYAKRNPGTLNFGSTSLGSSAQMGGELLKKMGGVDIVHVPYQGGGPMMTALISGQVQMAIDNLPSALPHIQAGKVRALAVTTPARFPGEPNIPTVAESGLPGYEVLSWNGLLGPKNLPAPIVERLNKELNASLQDEAFRAQLLRLGLEAYGGPPSRLTGIMTGEITKWKEVVRANKLQLLN